MLSATDFASRYSEADVIVSLAISPFEADLLFLQRMFDDVNWKLFTAHTCKEGMAQLDHEQIPIVICEAQLPDGSWKDMLSRLAPILEPPRLLVASHHADERLWSEVLNLGGFDLLATPFRQVEVGYAVGSAWVGWKYGRAGTASMPGPQRAPEREAHYGIHSGDRRS
jgi:DNA-binding NtrC family response regulator